MEEREEEEEELLTGHVWTSMLWILYIRETWNRNNAACPLD